MRHNWPILTSTPGIQGLCGLFPDSRPGFEHAGTSAVQRHPVFLHPVPVALPSIPPLASPPRQTALCGCSPSGSHGPSRIALFCAHRWPIIISQENKQGGSKDARLGPQLLRRNPRQLLRASQSRVQPGQAVGLVDLRAPCPQRPSSLPNPAARRGLPYTSPPFSCFYGTPTPPEGLLTARESWGVQGRIWGPVGETVLPINLF